MNSGMKLLAFGLAVFCQIASGQTNTTTKDANKLRALTATAPIKISEPQQIRVISIGEKLSTYYKCQTSIGQIYILGLPNGVMNDATAIKTLEAQITKEKEKIKQEKKKLNADTANAPSSAPSGSPAGNYIRQLNVRQNELDERANDLDELVEKFSATKNRFEKSSQITAIDTGRKYGLVSIWQVVADISK